MRVFATKSAKEGIKALPIDVGRAAPKAIKITAPSAIKAFSIKRSVKATTEGTAQQSQAVDQVKRKAGLYATLNVEAVTRESPQGVGQKLTTTVMAEQQENS